MESTGQWNEVSKAILDAMLDFIDTDLIKLIHNIHSGEEMSVNPSLKMIATCDAIFHGM
jgi:hypothetical protein